MRTEAKSERPGPLLYKIPCWTTEVRADLGLNKRWNRCMDNFARDRALISCGFVFGGRGMYTAVEVF